LELRGGERSAFGGASGRANPVVGLSPARFPLQAGRFICAAPAGVWSAPGWRAWVLYLTQGPVAHGGTVEAKPALTPGHSERRRAEGCARAAELLAALGRDPSFLARRERLQAAACVLALCGPALDPSCACWMNDGPPEGHHRPVEGLLIAWLGAGPRAAPCFTPCTVESDGFASRTWSSTVTHNQFGGILTL